MTTIYLQDFYTSYYSDEIMSFHPFYMEAFLATINHGYVKLFDIHRFNSVFKYRHTRGFKFCRPSVCPPLTILF